jgi:hypothetical protein
MAVQIGLQIGLCQFTGAGFLAPLADAAIYK